MLKLDLITNVKTELDNNGIQPPIPTSKIISKKLPIPGFHTKHQFEYIVKVARALIPLLDGC